MNAFEMQNESRKTTILRCLALLLTLLMLILPFRFSFAESEAADDSYVILDDPELFLFSDDSEAEPTDWDAYYEALFGQRACSVKPKQLP